ncbi:MAG: serine/threonine-protein phosphatase [Polyangiaceae bacterium]|nr:serine/threonine-protein phosphatase [Polyangiaceae bacterium]
MHTVISRDSSDEPTLPMTLDDADDETTFWRGLRVFEAAGITHPGQVRKNNEDAYRLTPELGFCAVADGLGGHAGGEVASSLAVGNVHRFLEDVATRRAKLLCSGHEGQIVMSPAFELSSLGDLLVAAVQYANRLINETAAENEHLDGMATTFAGLLVNQGRAAVVHAGDSRVYRIRGGKVERLTTDHSLRELYLKVYKDAARPEIADRNATIVTRTVGGRPRVQPDVTTFAVEPDDVFLLCTDGLWNLVSDDEMGFALAGTPTLEATLAKLLATAYNRGGHDNITAVLVRCR